MAVIDHAVDTRPTWPTDEIDVAGVDIDYYPPADELTLFFGGEPVPSVSDFLTEPGFEDVAVLIDQGGRAIVGLQVIPMLAGAVREHPSWAVVAWGALAKGVGDETLRTVLPEFFGAIRAAFERSWPLPRLVANQQVEPSESSRP
jgi:hypothetical protein